MPIDKRILLLRIFLILLMSGLRITKRLAVMKPAMTPNIAGHLGALDQRARVLTHQVLLQPVTPGHRVKMTLPIDKIMITEIRIMDQALIKLQRMMDQALFHNPIENTNMILIMITTAGHMDQRIPAKDSKSP